MDLANPTYGDILIFMLVFVRVTAMLVLLPVFGSQYLPVQVTVGLSFALSIVLMPYAKGHEVIAIPPSLAAFSVLIIKEVFVGIVVGFVASFLFVALQFAGHLVDTQIGFGFAEVVDPFTDMPGTVLGQLQVIVFTIVFLLMNGHYFLILAIQKSFVAIPLLGVSVPSGPMAQLLTTMVGGIFAAAIKIAAPVFVTLILTYVALGVLARTVPQLNVFFVGMPMSITVGLGTTIIVFPLLAHLFINMFQGLMKDIWRLLYLMA